MTDAPRPLRVLAIHRYYWPDSPPYASLLRAIVARWHADGHRVDVLSSQPSYKPEQGLARRPGRERVDDAMVTRIVMKPDRAGRVQRLVNLLRFPLLAALRVLTGPRYDVVMCSTAPQVFLGWMVSVAARLRDARFVYHCMDLHPEIGALSGEFANPVLFRILQRLDTAACRRAAAVVVLSEDMKAALVRRDPALADRIVVLNNFELPSYDEADTTSPLPQTDKVRIAFTGNLGRFQSLETITRAALGDDPALEGLELAFMGEGAAKADLERLVAEAPETRRHRIRFVPHGSPAEAKALLRTADHGLVSLTPGVIEFAYPSKTATYLSEGVPLLVAVEPDSELAAMVTRTGVGRHLPVDDTIGKALSELAAEGKADETRREAARAQWRRDFSADVQLPRWAALLADVTRGAR